MTDIRELPDHGLMLDSHDLSRADALAAVRAHLLAAGVSAFDAETATLDRPGLVAQAWWSDEHGFVQEHHDDGRRVTVVHVEVPR